jgi:hypothetical protein
MYSVSLCPENPGAMSMIGAVLSLDGFLFIQSNPICPLSSNVNISLSMAYNFSLLNQLAFFLID